MPDTETTSIRDELCEATGLSPKKGEAEQSFLHRLVDAVQEFKDPQWNELSEEAQNWVNKGASAITDDGDEAKIAGFPDEDEAETETEEQEESMSETNGKADPKPAAKKKTDKKKPAEKAAATKSAAPKERKSTPPKPTGLKVQIKKLVLKKPSMSVDEIMDKLGAGGVKPSKLTVTAIRSEFRHSLFVLRDAGALSGDVKLD